MTRIEIILIAILIMIFIIYISFIGYLIYNSHLLSSNLLKNKDIPLVNGTANTNTNTSSYQTDFFKQSSDHAQEVLFGKHFIPEYGQSNYYGNTLFNVLNKLNADTKNNISTAIKYLGVEPIASKEYEKLYRAMVEQEQVPLWFIILRESTNKIVPEFSLKNNPIVDNKVVPLYSNTA